MRKSLMGIFAGIKMAFFRSVNEKPTDSHTQLLRRCTGAPQGAHRAMPGARKEIVGISQDASIEELKQQFIDTKLSRLVVYNKTIDRIVG
jgi:hypothetical protein